MSPFLSPGGSPPPTLTVPNARGSGKTQVEPGPGLTGTSEISDLIGQSIGTHGEDEKTSCHVRVQPLSNTDHSLQCDCGLINLTVPTRVDDLIELDQYLSQL